MVQRKVKGATGSEIATAGALRDALDETLLGYAGAVTRPRYRTNAAQQPSLGDKACNLFGAFPKSYRSRLNDWSSAIQPPVFLARLL